MLISSLDSLGTRLISCFTVTVGDSVDRCFLWLVMSYLLQFRLSEPEVGCEGVFALSENVRFRSREKIFVLFSPGVGELATGIFAVS